MSLLMFLGNYRDEILNGLILPSVRLLVVSSLLFTQTQDLYRRHTPPPQDQFFDFIVVGSGSAGGVVASRLAEVSSWKVLLLEAGGPPLKITSVPGLNLLLFRTPNDWGYRTTKQKYSMYGYQNNSNPYIRGKAVGGCTAINFMMYVRGNRRDYENWVQLGNPGWDYDTVLKYFKKSEDYRGSVNFKNVLYHSTGGPMQIQEKLWGTPCMNAFLEAGEELGFSVIDPSGPSQIGFSKPDLTTRGGIRESIGEAFIKFKLTEPNFDLLPEAHVTQIIFDENKRAVGVKYLFEGVERVALAKREVIISGGAIDSPKLLMLSGIGPRKQLEEHQIPVLVDLPGVGQNLQDQPVIFGFTYTSNPGQTMSTGNLTSKKYEEYKSLRTGPFSVPFAVEGNAFVKLGPGDPEWPDVQILTMSMGVHVDEGFVVADSIGFREDLFNAYFGPILFKSAFSFGPIILRPLSRGSVTLKSKSPLDPPLIDPNFLSHPNDVELFVKALRFCSKIGSTEAYKKLGSKFHDLPLPGCDHLRYDSDEYWACYARHLASTIYHPVGTCKMAPSSDSMGVVDHRLRVRHVKGLRVIDASIMPLIISGNTNAPVIMIGERGADLIKEDWGVLSQ